MTKEELEQENAELEVNMNVWDENVRLVINLRHEIESLEKENAKLQARINAINLLTLELEKRSKLKTQQLTKAKELLEEFIFLLQNPRTALDTKTVMNKAEQFLRNTDIDNAIQQANEGLDFDKIADEMEQDLKESE